MGQGPVETLIGLGDNQRIETLSVRWPSGKSQTFSGIAANGTLLITEGSSKIDFTPW